MFSNICYKMNLRPSFLDILTTFGYRTSDTDAYHSSIWRGSVLEESTISPQKVYGEPPVIKRIKRNADPNLRVVLQHPVC
jgi:hypothetical protein